MKRWLNDFKQFLPDLRDGARDYPLTMLFVAVGIGLCLASPARCEEDAEDWRAKLGAWLIRNAPLPKT